MHKLDILSEDSFLLHLVRILAGVHVVVALSAYVAAAQLAKHSLDKLADCECALAHFAWPRNEYSAAAVTICA